MKLLNITIPVLNEEAVLEASVARIVCFMREQKLVPFEVVVADNGSTDGTRLCADRLTKAFPEVRVLRLDQAGRGRALKRAWLESSAEILSYMDVDLSTDLDAFPKLIEPLASGSGDLSVGSRLLNPRLTTRCWRREIISRVYNMVVRSMFGTGFSDAQCGFKAIHRRAAVVLLPNVQDNGWFFDTELLLWAESMGFRICDLPVPWIEDPDSRVRVWQTALEDLRGLLRLRATLPKRRQSLSNCAERRGSAKGSRRL